MATYQTTKQCIEETKAFGKEASGDSLWAGRTRVLGNYLLLEKIGAGGMGEVYLAEQRFSKRRCAVKVIRGDRAHDGKAIARFEREANALACLCHPNTTCLLDRGVTEDGIHFFVMEYLPGMNLGELVECLGPLPVERVLYLLKQVCSALQEAHERGFVHRDIKPANIIATEVEGKYDVAKLLDFGLVKFNHESDSSIHETGSFVGTPSFSPPEGLQGGEELDARGDIYSLGATAYYLLTGKEVWADSDSMCVLLTGDRPLPMMPSCVVAGVSAELDDVIMKCLANHREDRFQNVTSLAEALANIEVDQPWTSSHAESWWKENAAWTQAKTASDELVETCILSKETK